jgi:hypothetical protein
VTEDVDGAPGLKMLKASNEEINKLTAAAADGGTKKKTKKTKKTKKKSA